VAMNPIDHPHGGGNGKKSKPCDPKNPWGRTFKNRSTTTYFRHRTYAKLTRF
jgi:ribosomal protein L2